MKKIKFNAFGLFDSKKYVKSTIVHYAGIMTTLIGVVITLIGNEKKDSSYTLYVSDKTAELDLEQNKQ